MFTKSKKDIDIDNLLSNVLNLQKPSLSRNKRKSLGFLLKSSRPLTISFIAILLTATSVFATQKVIVPYLTKADQNNEQTTSEPSIVFESEQDTSEAEEADAIEGILINSSPNPNQISYPTSSPTNSSIPNYIPPVVQPSPSPTPTFEPTESQQKTYSIIPLGDISSFPESERILWINAYSEFLQTPNLQYMDYEAQDQYFIQIVEKYYIKYKQDLQDEIAYQKEKLDLLRLENQVNSEIEMKLDELKQIFENIQNKPVAMNVIEGRKQRAYQDWVKNNPEIFSQIQSSRYVSDLNAILTAYGMY